MNPGLSHPMSIGIIMLETPLRRKFWDQHESESRSESRSYRRSFPSYKNIVSFDKTRSRAARPMRIFTVPTDLSADCTRIFLPRFLSARRDAMYANSLPEGIEGKREGFVDERRLSQRFSSRRSSCLRSFSLSSVCSPSSGLSSFSVTGQWMPICWSGWFDEAWWMLLESRDSAWLGACNEQNRGLNRQRQRAVRYSRRRGRRRWRGGRDLRYKRSPPYCIGGT